MKYAIKTAYPQRYDENNEPIAGFKSDDIEAALIQYEKETDGLFHGVIGASESRKGILAFAVRDSKMVGYPSEAVVTLIDCEAKEKGDMAAHMAIPAKWRKKMGRDYSYDTKNEFLR